MSKTFKQNIDNIISDMIADFLYYDRKEDSQLKVGDIEKALEDNVITIEEMVQSFRKHLIEGLDTNE